MKLADIVTNTLDDQNENIDKTTNDRIDDDKLSENDSDITQYDEINKMVIKKF